MAAAGESSEEEANYERSPNSLPSRVNSSLDDSSDSDSDSSGSDSSSSPERCVKRSRSPSPSRGRRGRLVLKSVAPER
eukprot:5951942-Alexandrium_andersonii.AAC.1